MVKISSIVNMFTKTTNPPKKTLDDLLSSKDIITGKEVIHNIKEQEKRQKEFDESVEDELTELRYERHVTINTKVFNNLGECYE